MSKWSFWNGATILRGANIFQQADSGDPWGPKIIKDDIVKLQEAGANYLNLSVPGIYNVNTKDLNQNYLLRLTEIINWCEDLKINVVLSYRTGPGRGEGDIIGQGNSNRSVFFELPFQTAYADMWKFTASYFLDYTCIVAYDLMVEPHDCDLGVWRFTAQKCINNIRLVDSTIPIIISPSDWGTADSLDFWTPMQGNNLVYSVHQYEPYDYTHNNLAFDTKYKVLTKKINKILAWKNTYKVPVVVNEFGCKLTRPKCNLFLKKQVELLEQIGVNWAVWNWEVSDPNYKYHAMDIRSDLIILNLFKTLWIKNQKKESILLKE